MWVTRNMLVLAGHWSENILLAYQRILTTCAWDCIKMSEPPGEKLPVVLFWAPHLQCPNSTPKVKPKHFDRSLVVGRIIAHEPLFLSNFRTNAMKDFNCSQLGVQLYGWELKTVSATALTLAPNGAKIQDGSARIPEMLASFLYRGRKWPQIIYISVPVNSAFKYFWTMRVCQITKNEG